MASSVLPFGRSELCLQEKGRKRSGERDKTLLGGLIISYAHEKERERNMFFFRFLLFFFKIKGFGGGEQRLIQTKRLKAFREKKEEI